jgi:hypothetical protein
MISCSDFRGVQSGRSAMDLISPSSRLSLADGWYRIKRKSPLLRRSVSTLKLALRALHRVNAGSVSSLAVLANAIPKSGTHLLVQILEAVPGLRNFDVMLVSLPSLSYRERSPSDLLHRIDSVLPGELVSGHLFHEAEYAQRLRRRGIAQVFIYRDPRDIAISEAMYLTYMTRWHAMHTRFRRLPDDDSRISLSICGLPPDETVVYGNIRQRILPFLGWLGAAGVCAVKYEDLLGPDRERHLLRIAEFVQEQADQLAPGLRGSLGTQAMAGLMTASIKPTRSRTFRSGGTAKWVSRFTAEHHREFRQVAGDLLERMGYDEHGGSGP